MVRIQCDVAIASESRCIIAYILYLPPRAVVGRILCAALRVRRPAHPRNLVESALRACTVIERHCASVILLTFDETGIVTGEDVSSHGEERTAEREEEKK